MVTPRVSFNNQDSNVDNDKEYDAKCSGGRLNKKDGLTRYGNSHVKDKTS